MEDIRKRTVERTDRKLEENQTPKSSAGIEYYPADWLNILVKWSTKIIKYFHTFFFNYSYGS